MQLETVLPNETDARENRIAEEITARLREAVPDGDAAEVSRRSDVPYASLRAYLNGRQPKPAALVAIAKAVGVRLDWLLAGEGPMRADGGMGEQAASYRSRPLPTDSLDEANLAWALEFVEKTVSSSDGAQRVPLMLSAAAEFRRVQRMPALPLFQQPVLAAALTAAEQLLQAAGQPLDAGRRVGLMLAIYALVESDQVAR